MSGRLLVLFFAAACGSWAQQPGVRHYYVGSRRIDLRNRNGSAFSYDDVGGVDCLRLIRAQATAVGLL